MRDLEDIIRENREALDHQEPAAGHFDRFANKLNAAEKPQSRFTLSTAFQVAAVVLIILLAGNQMYLFLKPEIPAETFSLSQISDEYREVEFFYTSSIDASLQQWEKLRTEGFVTQAEQAMLDQEMKEFEHIFAKLRDELAANPHDERVINAVIDYYRAKLNLITLIIEKLEEVKQLKMSYHETENIL